MGGKKIKSGRRECDAELTEDQIKWWNERPKGSDEKFKFIHKDGSSEMVGPHIRERVLGTLMEKKSKFEARKEKFSNLISDFIINKLISEFRNPENIKSFLLSGRQIEIALLESIMKKIGVALPTAEGLAERQRKGVKTRHNWLDDVNSSVRKKVLDFLSESLCVKLVGKEIIGGAPGNEKLKFYSVDWKSFVNNGIIHIGISFKDSKVYIFKSHNTFPSSFDVEAEPFLIEDTANLEVPENM